jgi:exosortase family protein XrtF
MLIFVSTIQKAGKLKVTFIQKNKSVIKFLLIFFGSYLLLAGGYKLYLHLSESGAYFPDYVTYLVATQSENLLQSFGYETFSIPYEKNQSIRLALDNRFVVQVIEGCNGVSVIILFASFVLSFFSGWKKTLLFIFGGSVLIYALNVLRVALITMGIFHYPEYTELLHEILFPLFIYGIVFLLWVIWVRQYKKPKKAEDE